MGGVDRHHHPSEDEGGGGRGREGAASCMVGHRLMLTPLLPPPLPSLPHDHRGKGVGKSLDPEFELEHASSSYSFSRGSDSYIASRKPLLFLLFHGVISVVADGGIDGSASLCIPCPCYTKVFN